MDKDNNIDDDVSRIVKEASEQEDDRHEGVKAAVWVIGSAVVTSVLIGVFVAVILF